MSFVLNLASRRVITLPNGKQCGLPTYVHAWKTIHRMVREGHGSEEIAGFGDWPRPAVSILRSIQYGVDDRVNIRGGIDVSREYDPYKYLWRRIRTGRIVRHCRWCGEEFKPTFLSQRYCCDDCARANR